jgi:hypothetical protein
MTSESNTKSHESTGDAAGERDVHGRPRTVDVVVNARPHEVATGEIAFETVVGLAFPTPPGPNVEYTVTFRQGSPNRPKGSLLPGTTVKVHEGMIFNVTATDKS